MQSHPKFKLPVHLIGWAIFFVAPLLLSPGLGLSRIIEPNVVWPTLVRNFILMGLFYLNLFYVTPVILKRYGIVSFLIVIVVAIIAVSILNNWIHMTYTDNFYRAERMGSPGSDFGGGPGLNGLRPAGPPRGPILIFAGPLFSNFLITIIVVSVSTSIVFWNDWNNARQADQDRALQKVASELAVLKLQVSPHFLFNTLNNIRWLIRSKSDRAEEAVVKLSQLLRYILYQTNDERVSLEKEVENLRDLISLQKMRLVNEQVVEFNVTGDLAGKMITPLLFVPLVENFFKHGDFDSGATSKISLEVSDNRLVFRTENAVLEKMAGVVKADSGIGVANVMKRLALHYPNKHLFHISEEGKIYKVEMELLLV